MALYRTLQTKFWTDTFIQGLTPEQKLIYIYLITNPETTQTGIYEISLTTVSFHTGLKVPEIEEAIRYFQSKKRVIYSQENNEIFIVNWLKNNYSRSPKVAIRFNKDLELIKTKEFKEILLKSIKSGGIEISHDDIPDVEIEELKTKKKPVYLVDSTHFIYAKKFKEILVAKFPSLKTPNLQTWAHDFHGIIDTDKRNLSDLDKVIAKIAENDSGWWWNDRITAPSALRGKTGKGDDRFILILSSINSNQKKSYANENLWGSTNDRTKTEITRS